MSFFTVNQPSAAGETLHIHIGSISNSDSQFIKCLLMGSSTDQSQLITAMVDEEVDGSVFQTSVRPL